MNSTDKQPDGTSEFTSGSPAGYPEGKPESRKDGGRMKMPPPRIWGGFILILLMNYLLASRLVPGPESPATVPYTMFKQEVGKGTWMSSIAGARWSGAISGLRSRTRRTP